MKKTVVLILFVFVALAGCKGNSVENSGQGAAVQAPKKTKMSINFDLSEEKRLQQAADHGSQTWRNNAVDVAHAALITQGINAKIDQCVLTEAGDGQSVVNAKCKDGEFNITVKKIVRPDGIWTATDIELVGDYKGLGAPAHPAGHDHGAMDNGHEGR